MKTSLKTALLSFALAGSLFSASAIDFGGMLTNDSKLAGNKFNKMLLTQKNALSAWLRLPFNDKGTTYFTMEGLYQFEQKNIDVFKVEDDSSSTNANAADLSLFKFATVFENQDSKVSLSVGRFFATDLTGLVYAQAADGFLASFDFPLVTLGLYGAYTGLLNARTVSMLNGYFTVDSNTETVTKTDFFTEDYDKHYQRAEEYVVGAATLSIPNLVAGQTISTQFLSTFHLTGKGYNRMYAELAIGGPLVSTLFYSLNTTFGFLNYYDADSGWEVGNLSKLTLAYYAPFKNLAVTLSGTYASGNNGGLKPFTGFTSQTATNANSGRTELTGMIKASGAVSIKPIKNLLVGANGDAIFNAAESVKYEGFQYGANVNWQIVSDVSVGVLMYQYYDKDDSNRHKSCVQLKAAISF